MRTTIAKTGNLFAPGSYGPRSHPHHAAGSRQNHPMAAKRGKPIGSRTSNGSRSSAVLRSSDPTVWDSVGQRGIWERFLQCNQTVGPSTTLRSARDDTRGWLAREVSPPRRQQQVLRCAQNDNLMGIGSDGRLAAAGGASRIRCPIPASFAGVGFSSVGVEFQWIRKAPPGQRMAEWGTHGEVSNPARMGHRHDTRRIQWGRSLLQKRKQVLRCAQK